MSHRPAFRTLRRILNSFRTLILLMIIGALLVTAAGFMFFTRKEVTRAMLNAGDESATNVLRIVKLNIESQHKNLRSFEQYARERYREQLKNLVAVVISQIDFFHEMYEKGILSEEQAKTAALESTQKLRYGKNDYFFIFDKDNIAISHPDPATYGKDMSEVKDLNGHPVLKTWKDITAQTGKEPFFTVWWLRLGEAKPAPKLIYYFHYPKWDWMVGTGVYTDDIDSDVGKKMAEIMDLLKETFGAVKVSENGYFFLFDGDKRILIHPYLSGLERAEHRDPVTDESLFDQLVKASGDPARAWKHLWDKPTHPGQFRFTKYTHVERFEPFDWYIASSVFEDDMEQPAHAIVRNQMMAVSVIVLLCVLGVSFLVARVMGPLARLSRHTDRLSEQDFSLPPEESDRLLAVTFPREVGRLSRTIWNMERRLREYLETLKEATAAKERIESELRIAREIQLSMVPKDLSAFKGRSEVDLAAKLAPAREVGGDLYDFFFIDDDRLCLLVGDVSDKGVPSALFMVRSMTLLRNGVLREGIEPDTVLSSVNRELGESNDLCMFLTLFLGILDVKTGELIYSNAGHLPPLLLDATGGHRTLELPRGLPLGLSKKAKYSCRRLRLAPGEGLLLFTDGITEAGNLEGTFFDYPLLEHVLDNLRQTGPNPPDASTIVETVFREVETFSRGVPQSDDIAILCVRRVESGIGGKQE